LGLFDSALRLSISIGLDDFVASLMTDDLQASGQARS
jgi:hypothetical protein